MIPHPLLNPSTETNMAGVGVALEAAGGSQTQGSRGHRLNTATYKWRKRWLKDEGRQLDDNHHGNNIFYINILKAESPTMSFMTVSRWWRAENQRRIGGPIRPSGA